MIVVGLIRIMLGAPPVAESAEFEVKAEQFTQAGIVLLLLRSFASGCSALTGVEAVANGVPAFRTPKVKNAQRTLALMGGIAITLFVGVTTLALVSGVHYAENPCDLEGFSNCATQPQRSIMAQLAAAVFGGDTQILFFVIQGTTAAVLLLAANTAFNGFPLLGSVLARNGYAPKSLSTRGDRLVYSNGVLVLGLGATILLVVYQANLTALIQLYIIGVFVSFTLGQSGMVKHWIRELRAGAGGAPLTMKRRQIIRSLSINTFGAALTGTVLIVVTVTKFTHGAWLVFAIGPVLYALMLSINRYYQKVERDLAVDNSTMFGANGDHAIVLVGALQKPTLKALDYAIAARHDSLEAVHCSIDDEQTAELKREWKVRKIQVPLRVIQSPYRDISFPLIKYIKKRRESHGAEVVTVYMPQFIVGHWWENLLHNHKARRIRHKLMLCHGVAIALVPWLLDSSQALYARPGRPLPGQERRGEPVRKAVIRKQLPPARTGARKPK
jgi:hypothetical protein